jgi:V8-like Glu-specific endopeptidase
MDSVNGRCTATLVSPRVVLTAAHCLEYKTIAKNDVGLQFIIEENGRKYIYWASRYRSYSTTLGFGDVGLIQLRSAIPSKIAKPASLAPTMPNDGEPVMMWGYGCTSRNATDWEGVKRSFSYHYRWTTRRNCSGDSGGPRTRADGTIFALNSNYNIASGNDGNADVPALYETLQTDIAKWSQ